MSSILTDAGDKRRLLEMKKRLLRIDPHDTSASKTVSLKDRKEALHIAISGGQEACFVKLLSCGANSSAEDKIRRTPVHLSSENGNRIILRQLLGQKDVRLGAKTLTEGFSPLHCAIKAGSITAAEMLLKAGVDPNLRDNKDRTPLFMAQDGESISLLLRFSATPLIRDKDGCTALHRAVEDSKTIIIPALLDAEIKATDHDGKRRNSFHIAVSRGDHDMVRLLLLKDKHALDTPDGQGLTPVHMATKMGDIELVLLLRDNGAELSHKGYSPLHITTKSGRTDLVNLFLSHKQNPNVTDSIGLAPLSIAAGAGNFPIIKALIKYGAQISRPTLRGGNCLQRAIQKGNTELVELLLTSLNTPTATDEDRRLVLHPARIEIKLTASLIDHMSSTHRESMAKHQYLNLSSRITQKSPECF